MDFIVVRQAPNFSIRETHEHIVTLKLERVHICVCALTLSLQILAANKATVDIESTQRSLALLLHVEI